MRVGLALSGGGALGGAHLGILEEIDRRIGIDIICGSSSGAIIGLLYADGGSESVHRFKAAIDRAGIGGTRVALLARSPSVTFETLRVLLADNVRARSFDELPIKLSCIATDIASGEAVVIEDGDPIAAAMASSAFPGIFRAQQIGGRLVVDGGVSMNVPAGVVRSQGADFVVGSSLYGNLMGVELPPRGRQPSRVQAAMRAIDIMAKQLANMQCRECDFCFHPPVDTFRWFDLGRLAEIIELGRVYAREEIGSLLAAMHRVEVHSL